MSSEWVALLKGDRNDVDAPRLVKDESNDWRLGGKKFCAPFEDEARSRVTPHGWLRRPPLDSGHPPTFHAFD